VKHRRGRGGCWYLLMEPAVVAHAESVAVRLLADRSGLAKELSKATRGHSLVPVHDRGRALRPLRAPLGGESAH
jgi:hypothetical protein